MSVKKTLQIRRSASAPVIAADELPLIPFPYLPGMKPNLDPVPVPLIAGKCVYGHILTDRHRDYFRNHAGVGIEDGPTSLFEGLVSTASQIVNQRDNEADTADVYVQGEPHVCLIHVDNRFSRGFVDKRRSKEFMEALEKSLGIIEKPQWYPCYVN